MGFAIWGLVSFLGLTVGAPGEDKKPNAKTPSAAEMVGAIVNRNQAPKLVKWPGMFPDTEVAVYPEAYDWKEEGRVRTALQALSEDRRAEVWEEMVRRGNDPGYCVVSTDGQEGSASLETIGMVCRELAYWRLVAAFQKHLPTTDGRRVRLDIGVNVGRLTEWRKARADKSLYELQIEVCKKALQELAREKDLPKRKKELARQEIETTIDNLRKTKQPDFTGLSVRLLYYREFRYNAETARRVREAVKSGKYPPLWELGIGYK
jgi:hypothetical protein